MGYGITPLFKLKLVTASNISRWYEGRVDGPIEQIGNNKVVGMRHYWIDVRLIEYLPARMEEKIFRVELYFTKKKVVYYASNKALTAEHTVSFYDENKDKIILPKRIFGKNGVYVGKHSTYPRNKCLRHISLSDNFSDFQEFERVRFAMVNFGRYRCDPNNATHDHTEPCPEPTKKFKDINENTLWL